MSEKRFSLSFWLFFLSELMQKNITKETREFSRRAQQQQYTEEEELCVSSCFASVLMIHWTLTNERLLFAATFHGGPPPHFLGFKTPLGKKIIRQKSSKKIQFC
jgi:hypothetical protein